jgi:serine protease Do
MIGPIMKSLVATGSVQRGWLGIAIQEVDRDLGQALGLTAGDGVLVADVEADTPAAKAGLRRGDVIRSVEGEKMKSSSQLRNKVAALAPGATARLEVVRDGKPETVDVVLGTLPDDEAAAAGRPSRRGDRDRSQGDGVVSEGVLGGAALRPLTDGLRRRLQIPAQVRSGVVIAEVEPGSGADRLGLRPGDVVVEVDRRPVRDPAQLRALSKSARDAVAVVVVRDGRTIYLAGKR